MYQQIKLKAKGLLRCSVCFVLFSFVDKYLTVTHHVPKSSVLYTNVQVNMGQREKQTHIRACSQVQLCNIFFSLQAVLFRKKKINLERKLLPCIKYSMICYQNTFYANGVCLIEKMYIGLVHFCMRTSCHMNKKI